MQKNNEKQHAATFFPPVVAVLGHVDHGKTTLLDAIRETSIADREFGGITQGIGTSVVETMYEGQKRYITFIDTPGHEAFTTMRSRGTQAADIGLLIVSAVDGVMPQTRESIQLLKSATISPIVVLTKSDLPTKNSEKVKQQLLREDMLLEGYGGDIPVIEVSAKTGQNIKELLDLILLVAQLHPLDPAPASTNPLQAIVIESKLDQKAGAKATVIIKNGTIHVRDELACNEHVFKVRSIIDSRGKQVPESTVGEGVELFGMSTVLTVGSLVTDTAHKVDQVVEKIPQRSGEFIYHKSQQAGRLSLILCADTQGSLEAILHSLPDEVDVIDSKTGEITEADVLRAKAIGGIVLGFNTKIRSEVMKLAMTEKILVKNYRVIYEMLDEIGDVVEGKQVALLETILGQAKVLAQFPYEKTQAYGISIVEGRVARGDKIRVMRGEKIIGESTIQSLRVGKNPTSKVEKGHEAGILLVTHLDITIGDMLLSIG